MAIRLRRGKDILGTAEMENNLSNNRNANTGTKLKVRLKKGNDVLATSYNQEEKPRYKNTHKQQESNDKFDTSSKFLNNSTKRKSDKEIYEEMTKDRVQDETEKLDDTMKDQKIAEDEATATVYSSSSSIEGNIPIYNEKEPFNSMGEQMKNVLDEY